MAGDNRIAAVDRHTDGSIRVVKSSGARLGCTLKVGDLLVPVDVEVDKGLRGELEAVQVLAAVVWGGVLRLAATAARGVLGTRYGGGGCGED